MTNKVIEQKEKNIKTKRKNIAWTVALSMMSGVIFGLAFLLYSSYSTSNNYAASLETTYQKSYYDLVDKVGNIEVKLSKTVSSNDNIYSEKVLNEISKNCEDAQNNLNMLPITLNGVEESLKFINQLGGYSKTLAQKLSKGQSLTQEEKATLKKLHEAVNNMKGSLNKMSQSMWEGYSILNEGLSIKGDYNDITLNLQAMKAQDVEYPTMIYDGPFADSQILQEVKGLKGQTNISQEDAKEKLSKIFDISAEQINFETEAKSNFTTYDFSFEKNNIEFYAQVTKQGGFLLTVSSHNDLDKVNINKEKALQVSEQFLEKAGIKDVESVWSDVVGKDAYFNFAPVKDEVILYPDLVKVKVDLASGQVVGFESTSYYTHHTDRTLGKFVISKQQAQTQISGDYKISSIKKALSPIDFEELLTWEIKTLKDGSVYYFYVDATNGQLVNILRVIRTTNGNKLM